MVLPTPGGPTISTFAFSSTNRSVASSSTSERSRPGCASKSKSSRRLMTGKWAKRRRPASLAALGRGDLHAEQVLGERRVGRLAPLRGVEFGGQDLGGGGELQGGQVGTEALVDGVMRHDASAPRTGEGPRPWAGTAARGG